MRFGPVKHLSRTLRFQLTFWNTIAILVLVAATLWGVREGLRWTLLNEMDKALAEDIREVQHIVERSYPDLDEIRKELEDKAASHSARSWYVRIFKTDGTDYWHNQDAPELHMPIVSVVQHGPYNRGGYRL